jgi:hypothetical protein
VDEYLHSIIPEPVTILGQDLLPFSCGHYLLLSRLGCAFLVEDKEPLLGDLLLGLLVCSNTYEGAQELLRRAELGDDIKAWAENVGEFEADEKAKLFTEYINAALAMPKFWTKGQGGGTKAGAPWPQAMRVKLVSEGGFSASEVMNQPLGQTWWDYLTLNELKGAVKISDDTTEELLRRHREVKQEATD